MSRLGLAGHPEGAPRCVPEALEAGVNLFFFYNLGFTGLVDGLAPVGRRRDVFVATGSASRDPAEVEACLSQVEERLSKGRVDLFFAEYVHPGDDVEGLLADDGVVGLLRRWKAEGRIRYVGATAHDRPLAKRLVDSGRIDALMHRYNMAHRGAEEAVLPAALARRTPVVAFTCTRWGQLPGGHARWTGPVPSAADCYRFALRHEAVQVALTAPGSLEELRANLAALRAPEATGAEMAAWRAYGDVVHGSGRDEFETRWP